jgi:hypothetical protein
VQHLSPIKTADELARVAIEGSGAPGIYARRYSAAGTPRGGQLAVDTTHQNQKNAPAIAIPVV